MAPIPVEALQHHACGYTTMMNLPSILQPFRSDPAVRHLLMVYRASLGSFNIFPHTHTTGVPYTITVRNVTITNTVENGVTNCYNC